MATVTGTRRLLDISGNNISTAVSLEAEGTLLDSNGQSGTSNQVLISTATGVDWVDGSGSSIIGGPYLPLAGGTLTGDLIMGSAGTGTYSNELKFTNSGYQAGIDYQNNGNLRLIDRSNSRVGAYINVLDGKIAAYNTGNVITTLLNTNGNSYINGGNVGIGTTSPGAKLDIYDVFTKTNTNPNTVEVLHNGNVSANNIYPVAGLFTQRVSGGANSFATGLVGVADKQGDYGYVARGVQGIGKLSGNITVNNADMQYMGVEGRIEMEGSNSVNLDDRAYSFYGTAEIDSGSHLKEYHGLYLNTPTNNGTILNKYGVSQVDANSKNYFAGNVGIGVASPTADLHIQGSSDSDVPVLRVGGFGNSGSKLELAETLTSGDMNYGFSFFNDGNSSNTLLIKAHNNSTAGVTAITINRTNSLTTFNTVPVVGTRTAGDNSTRAASTAFVTAAITAAAPTVNNGTLTMTTNTGLDGGATFTANQSGNSAFAVSLDLSELTDMTQAMIGTDEFIVLDNGAERRKAANEIGLSIFNNDSGFLLDTTDTFTGTLTIDGELEMSNGPNGIIYTTDDVLTLSSGGKTGGTEIVIDDGASVIKLNSDTIAQGEFKVSSLTDGTGDDVFRALVTSSAASFSLGDIEGLGDGSYIVSDGSTIKLRNNGGINTLVTDNNNNVEIPSGTLTVSGSATADSLIKDGGTSSQFLKADGSVDSNTYLTTETGARMVQFNRSGINASTYTMLATVNGNNLASILKMTMTGTSGSVVFACTFDITVNHSTDIHVKSSNGDYTEVTLRITSNNNEDFSIEAKHNGGSTTTAEVCIYPLADEVITPTTTDPGYTGAEYEHTATEGWRFGGEDGNVESSNVIVDGKIGVGTTTPAGLLEVKGPEAYIYISDTTETDSGIIFRDVDAGLSQAAAIKYNSSNGKLQFYNNDTTAVRMTIDTAGNVGIGNTGPNYPLVVNGVSAANRFYIPNATATTAWVLQARNSANTSDSGLYFENGDAQLLLRDDSNNLNVRINSDSNSYINGGNLGIGITAPDAKLTVFRTVSNYAISRGDVEARAGLSVKSSSSYDSKLNFATGLNSQQYIQGLNNAATTGRPIVLNPYGGYVGINTANLPTQQLDIISGTNNGIRISATDTQTWRDIGIRSYVTEGQANALADHTFIYTTNPSSGTEDPFGKFGATVIQGRDNGNSGFAIRLGNGGGHATRMWMGGTGATTFSNTVTATNFILSSDERLKENIEQVCDNRVKADWKTFELKTEKGQKRYGVIAQELEKTNPEFVREDSQGFKSVAYIDLLIAKIAELEARLEKLEK